MCWDLPLRLASLAGSLKRRLAGSKYVRNRPLATEMADASSGGIGAFQELSLARQPLGEPAPKAL